MKTSVCLSERYLDMFFYIGTSLSQYESLSNSVCTTVMNVSLSNSSCNIAFEW